MTRLKVKKELVGQQIKLNPSTLIVFSEYMTDDEYQFAVKRFPDYFEKAKKVKKDDNS